MNALPEAERKPLQRVVPVSATEVVDPATAPGVTKGDLAKLKQRLRANDRAGVYVELYRMTGQEFWLMDAQITSYSGIWGGGALAANFLIKSENPERYKTALDTFSYRIVRNMLRLVEESVDAGQRGFVNPAVLLNNGDGDIWRENGLEEFFPGQGLFLDAATYGTEHLRRVFSTGTLYSARGVTAGARLGKRPTEFQYNDNYTTLTGKDGRFTTVIDNKTGVVEVFFDRDAAPMGMFSQADNVLLPLSALKQRARVWEYMQANQDMHPEAMSKRRVAAREHRAAQGQHVGANERAPLPRRYIMASLAWM